MRRSLFIIALILSGLMLMNVSCKKKKKTVEDPNWTNSYPTPGSGGTLPASILPASLVDSVTAYFNIYTGESPVVFMGEFVSHPHILLKSTIPGESAGTQFSDRYIAFDRHGDKIDFFGKQWSNDDDEYIVIRTRTKCDDNGRVVSAHYAKIYGPIGFGGEFTCTGLYFNPNDNDTNLEADTKINLMSGGGRGFAP